MSAKKRTALPMPDDPLLPKGREIPTGFSAAEKSWTFGFTHWVQAKNFGLDCEKVDSRWFVSFLDKLKDLSKESVDSVTKSYSMADQWRYHPVAWGDKHVQMSREQFFKEFLPTNFSPDDFEIAQFQITKANGRVIGFLDPDQVFQVVLLDPMHNLHTSSYSDYKIRNTSIYPTEFQKQYSQVQGLRSHVDKNCVEKCSLKTQLSHILETPEHYRYFCVDDLCGEEINTLVRMGKYDGVDAAVIEAFNSFVARHAADLSDPTQPPTK